MNRQQWKSAYAVARRKARTTQCEASISYPGDRWFLLRIAGDERTLIASIIRDRPITQRVAVELRWARTYRFDLMRAMRFDPHNLAQYFAARACIDDARRIRLNASQFQRLP